MITINNKKYTYQTRKIVANNIIYFRLKNNWSQEDFAEALGTTTNYISSLENAHWDSKIDYVGHVADTLNIPVYQLFIEREPIINHRKCRRRKKI